MCEFIKRHTSITVSFQWLNVLMMREKRNGVGGKGRWGRLNKKRSMKDKKREKSFDSGKLTTKPIPFASHQWVSIVLGKTPLCVCEYT